MKFNSLQHTGVRTFSVKEFNGGTNIYDLPSNVADNQLTECRNVWYDDGQMKTRPGINSTVSNILRQKNLIDTEVCSYFLTDTVFYVDGEYKQIAVANVNNSDSQYFSYIYLIGTDKSVIEAGYLVSNRITSDIFYKPENMLFYVGVPVNGGGIFAFLTNVNIYDETDRFYSIYEINSSMDGWTRADSYYIPTVYINGRGNRYEIAESTNQAYTGKPTTLESPNLLNGRFHAYFTSDGCSSCFRLPFSGISSSSVTCRVYHTLTEYVEWQILSGADSDTKTFFSASITLKIDREKGIIYFTDSEGEYPIPMMLLYHENNIRITAGKEIKDGFKNIVSSKCCSAFDSRIIFSGGCSGNTAYCTSYSNPLYFPQDAAVEIGEGDRTVTALQMQGNYILAFKKSEIYALKLSKGKPLNSNSLLADNDSVFYSSDTFDDTLISNNIGCANKNTLIKCANQPVWLGDDGNIYTLKSIAAKEIYEISKPLKPYLQSFSQEEMMSAFSISEKGHYLLMIGEKAIIMEYTIKDLKCPKYECSNTSAESIKWYMWDFPQDISIIGGMTNGGVIQLMCLGKDLATCYIASLDGFADVGIYYSGNNAVSDSFAISSVISTKHFDLGSYSDKKNIENIFLSLNGKSRIEIKINGAHFDFLDTMDAGQDFNPKLLKSVRLFTKLNGIKSVYITISSDDIICFGNMTLYYK